MTIRNTVPTVVICNITETFVDFLARATNEKERAELINGEAFHGDRTLLWGGDPKLVVVSYPIAHEKTIQELGFFGTHHIAPKDPTFYLSLDILREPHLLESLIAHAGTKRELVLLPYATTPEFLTLVDALREKHDLTINLPESPAKDFLWVRDFVDTKAGFRQLTSQWLSDADRLLPFGITCQNKQQAARAAYWFVSRGDACVVKADTGESGIGIDVIRPESHFTVEQIQKQLELNPFYAKELIVVEKYINSPTQLSPSPEVFVPKLGEGEPYIMYMTQQIFQDFGVFCGIEVSKQMYQQPWYPDLERSALTIGKGLQKMGYIGHFDLDCIVDKDGNLYLLEINSRRTGGTHVHDFAQHVIGEDYIDQVALLSYESMDAANIKTAHELLDFVKEFLYPINNNKQYGLVITITTALQLGRFGCITVAPTIEEAIELQNKVSEKIKGLKK